MKISLIAVGKLKETFWKQALGEYLKRLQSYADVEVIEVPDLDPSRLGEAQTLEREGEALLSRVPQSAIVVLLDIEGKLFTSEEIADLISSRANEGISHIAFVIGGSHGVSKAVRERADVKLSLGRVTLPHNLARVVIAEQIYRAFRIIRREPYHK